MEHQYSHHLIQKPINSMDLQEQKFLKSYLVMEEDDEGKKSMMKLLRIFGSVRVPFKSL